MKTTYSVCRSKSFKKYQCSFKIVCSAQHSLVTTLEKWKCAVDDKKVFVALLTDLSKGSLLGSILFIIFLSDFFLAMKESEFTSYADGNTLYDASNNIEDVISSLLKSSEKLFKWFFNNLMQGNSGKCHLILSTNEPAKIHIGESLIEKREKIIWSKNLF